MKDSEVLIKARELIKSGQQSRVCYAIERATASRRQADNLTDWVQRLLGRTCFYEDWVIDHHPKFAKKKGITTTDHYEKLRPGRIAWLTWMIEQCQAKEAE